MSYKELKPICDRLNAKFANKLLPTTNYYVKRFVIIPNEVQDPDGFERYVHCVIIGIPTEEIDKAIEEHPYLNIRIQFADKGMDGYYHPENFGLTVKILDSINQVNIKDYPPLPLVKADGLQVNRMKQNP